MPEYLAPGVHVEEVSYRSKSIEGVSTTTTGFVGPARFGPIVGEPELLTSFTQFERIYGGLDALVYATETDFAARNPLVNYLAHAVRAFFDNGGRRLYVARAFRSFDLSNAGHVAAGEPQVNVPDGLAADGHGRALIPAPSAETADAQRAAVNGVAAGNAALASGVNAATQAEQSATAARALATTVQGEAAAAQTAATTARNAAQAARATAVTNLTNAIAALDTALGGGIAGLAAIDEAADTRTSILAAVNTAIGANNAPAVVTARNAVIAALDARDAADANVATADAAIAAATTVQTNAATVITNATDAIADATGARDLAITPFDVGAKLAAALAAGEAAGATAALPPAPVVQNANTQAAASATLANTLAADAADASGTANTARQAAATAQGRLAAPGTSAERLGRASEAVTAAQAAADAGRDAVQAAIDLAGPAAVVLGPAGAAARDSRIAARAAVGAADARFRARFPGAAGNLRVTLRARLGQNALSRVGGEVRLSQVQARDLVFLSTVPGRLFVATRAASGAWSFVDGNTTVPLTNLNPDVNPGPGHTVRVVTFSVEALTPGAFSQPQLWDGLSADEPGVLNPRANDVRQVFAERITNRTRMLETPLVLEAVNAGNPPSAGALVASLIGGTGLAQLVDPTVRAVQTEYQLRGGNDGVRPTDEQYRGVSDEDSDGVDETSGLASFEGIEEISIVAAPGLSFGSNREFRAQATAATQALISHCERMRYRVAVLDSGDDEGISDVRNNRALLDTTRAAFYYPWVRIVDPISREPIHVPPSGFVTGIYARNDIDHGVHKAPANEVVLGAIWLETLLNKGQQEVLNPLGINCLRYFENRGIRVWGARTLSSDPEWKYLNIRRYFAYLERSIEKSTQWAVFEANGEALWANVRRAVEDFLFNEWKSERLAGAKPGEAFFVKCDRTTMTQNDLDNGRMICLIGVAPLYPAEFVIFRIGQWTADRPV